MSASITNMPKGIQRGSTHFLVPEEVVEDWGLSEPITNDQSSISHLDDAVSFSRNWRVSSPAAEKSEISNRNRFSLEEKI